MGSNRLPGKVMEIIEGKTVLEHIFLRLQAAKGLDDIVVATSTAKKDDLIVRFAESKGWKVMAGSEDDVLGRYKQAAEQFKADVVVRVCADSIFYDPVILDSVLKSFFERPYDYASTTIHRTYPRGIAVEILWRKTLEELNRLATTFSHREHVTLYILDNLENFSTLSFEDQSGQYDSGWRWVLDTREDLEFVREIYATLYHNNIFGVEDICEWVKEHPEKIIYHEQ